MIGLSRQSGASNLQADNLEEPAQLLSPLEIQRFASLNNSIAVEDFRSTIASPLRETNYLMRAIEMNSPLTDKTK